MACKNFTTEDCLAFMTAFREEMQSCRETFNKRLDQLERHTSAQPTIHSSSHPTVHPIVQPFIHPTDHPYVHPTDQPTIHPSDHPYIHLIESVLRTEPIQGGGNNADPSTRLIIHPTDDLFNQSVGRPSPTIRPIIYPTDDLFIQSVGHQSLILSHPAIQSDGPPIPIITDPPWNRASNRINPNQLKSTVPAIIRRTIQIGPNQAEPPRPPDPARPTFELSEGYLDITKSEWPLLLTGKETFLFQHLPGLTLKPPAGLGPKILITIQDAIRTRTFHD